MRISLKVDVDTLRGTLEGVPRLVSLFQKHEVNACFLFSLGPDNTGRALKRIFRPGFLQKVMRTSVTSNYGLKTLMYGVLIPGPHIGKKSGHVMRQTQEQGFEVGIHTYDHIRWQDYVARKDSDWTRHEMDKAWQSYESVFGESPRTWGSAGWQINPFALEVQDAWALDYASDARGTHPFLPRMNGHDFSTPQLPGTLPTLDELIGCDDITDANVHEVLLDQSQATDYPETGHVFTLHAELEGMAYLDVMDKLLTTWKQRGCTIGSTHELYQTLDLSALPRHEMLMAEIPGRSGTLALQGKAV
jgi:peptidoglycan/xylan/chitin deacetylase (PgdA/CDA1 family)